MTELMLLLGPLLLLTPRIVRRLRWAVRPYNAPVVLEFGRHPNTKVWFRVKSASTASRWADSPPRINVAGLDGLGWLVVQDVPGAEDALLETLRSRSSGFVEAEAASCLPSELVRLIALATKAQIS